MADVITKKVWVLDTATGLVTDNNVQISKVRLTFTTAGAGSCVLTTKDKSETILDVKTIGASTVDSRYLTSEWNFEGEEFAGLHKLTMVNVDTIYIQTR